MFSDPYVVGIRISESEDFAETMNRWREWLNSQKIQPTDFKAEQCEAGYVFSIGFRSQHDAERFRQAFGIATQVKAA